MKQLLFLLICASFSIPEIFAQAAYAPINRDYYHLLDRYEILTGASSHHAGSGFKPYRRDEIAAFVDSLPQQNKQWTGSDLFNFRYLTNDNWEFSSKETPNSKRPWKGMYNKPSDFFHYRDSVFDVHINPMIYFRGGVVSGDEDFQFRNTRGIEIRGSIDHKVGFYTFLATTETNLPPWTYAYAQYNGAVPGEGFWKTYRQSGFSYFSAGGYLSFQVSPHIQAQMGQDRNFVGEGYRSMILSDFSNPYMFFKLNTRIWKFNFTNLWGQMNADILYNRGRPTDGRYPKKWFSLHRLGINLGPNLNIGLFESVMSSQLDWNYLNPVIFYRWVEHQLGTPDKVMLGTDFKWNFLSRIQLYGQFTLDEFVFNEFFGIDGKNSSRNKHGLQLGFKHIDLLKISNLDLQLEYNQARPYTYQEKFDHQSYTNYRTPLTHPRGANFREGVAIIRYQPIPKLSLNATGVYHLYGTDPDEISNYGGDILKKRINQSTSLYGNKIGQGVRNTMKMGTLNASYMLGHHIFVDASHTYRMHEITSGTSQTDQYSQISLRMNISRQEFNY